MEDMVIVKHHTTTGVFTNQFKNTREYLFLAVFKMKNLVDKI